MKKYTVSVSKSELLKIISSRSAEVIYAHVNSHYETFPETLEPLNEFLAILRAENDEALALIEARRASYRTCRQQQQPDFSPPQEPEQKTKCSHKADSEQRHSSQSADGSEV